MASSTKNDLFKKRHLKSFPLRKDSWHGFSFLDFRMFLSIVVKCSPESFDTHFSVDKRTQVSTWRKVLRWSWRWLQIFQESMWIPDGCSCYILHTSPWTGEKLRNVFLIKCQPSLLASEVVVLSLPSPTDDATSQPPNNFSMWFFWWGRDGWVISPPPSKDGLLIQVNQQRRSLPPLILTGL